MLNHSARFNFAAVKYHFSVFSSDVSEMEDMMGSLMKKVLLISYKHTFNFSFNGSEVFLFKLQPIVFVIKT